MCTKKVEFRFQVNNFANSCLTNDKHTHTHTTYDYKLNIKKVIFHYPHDGKFNQGNESVIFVLSSILVDSIRPIFLIDHAIPVMVSIFTLIVWSKDTTEWNGTEHRCTHKCSVQTKNMIFPRVLCLWHQTPLTLALALSHHGISMLICYWIIHNFYFWLNSYSWLLLVVVFWIRNGPSK